MGLDSSGLVDRAFCGLVAVGARRWMVLFNLFRYPKHPSSLPGKYSVGVTRTRLPGSTHAQVLYPCQSERAGNMITDALINPVMSFLTSCAGSGGSGGSSTPYMRPEAVDELARHSGLPRILLNHLHAVPPLGKGHPSPLDAPVLPTKKGTAGWPIIVFSHGTWGCEEMYTSLCRSLASLGYDAHAISPAHPKR